MSFNSLEETSEKLNENGPDRGNQSTSKSLSTEGESGRGSTVTQPVNQTGGETSTVGPVGIKPVMN